MFYRRAGEDEITPLYTMPDSTPKVIISSSGMCEGGRIKHHLKHNLWKKKNSIVFRFIRTCLWITNL